MLAGCLPLLLQLPFFSVMYRLFLSKTVGGQPNLLLARNLLTTPLGSHWLTGAGLLSIHGLVFLGLFAVLAVVAFLTARAAGATGGNAPAGQPAMLGAIGRILPYTTLIIAAFVPLAAVLYLVTTTSWTAAERAVLRRWHRPAVPVSGAAAAARIAAAHAAMAGWASAPRRQAMKRAPPGGQCGQRHAVRAVGQGELGHHGHALAGRHERQHGGEVVGVVPDPRREAGGLAQPDCHQVAQRAGAADDPRQGPARLDWVGPTSAGAVLAVLQPPWWQRPCWQRPWWQRPCRQRGQVHGL